MTYVTSQATVARGVVVKIGNDEITEITDDGVPIPATEVDDIEVTNQNSGDWKEYKAGRKDGGECEIKANAVDGDPGQMALAAAAESGATSLFTVTFPSGSILTFYGTVKTFDHVVEDQILRISSKVKVSGEPQFATSASALTALAVKIGEAAQTLSPTFDAGKYKYICSVVTGTTTVNVVGTQAEAGATITINGKTATSGTNCAIDLATATTLYDIDVVVKQTGKAATIYHVSLFRA